MRTKSLARGKRSLQALLYLSLVVTGLNTSAAPPNRMDLPSELTWALHVDCDALRKAYIGKYFLYQLDKPEMYSNMVAFQSIFSFDLRTQLHGVTVYGGGGGLNDCHHRLRGIQSGKADRNPPANAARQQNHGWETCDL